MKEKQFRRITGFRMRRANVVGYLVRPTSLHKLWKLLCSYDYAPSSAASRVERRQLEDELYEFGRWKKRAYSEIEAHSGRSIWSFTLADFAAADISIERRAGDLAARILDYARRADVRSTNHA